jgi:hypothetical protein
MALSRLLGALYVSHTARQTRPLHRTPRKNASSKSRFTFVLAMRSAFTPTP